jgi:hypothetical protein
MHIATIMNLAFEGHLQYTCHGEENTRQPKLLLTGICSLHVVHLALTESSGWCMIQVGQIVLVGIFHIHIVLHNIHFLYYESTDCHRVKGKGGHEGQMLGLRQTGLRV